MLVKYEIAVQSGGDPYIAVLAQFRVWLQGDIFLSKLCTSHITTFALHNAIRPSTLAKHLPQIRHNRLGPLPRRKVAAPLMLPLEHHMPLRPGPRLRVDPQLLRKMRQADLDVRNELGQSFAGNLPLPAAPPIMHRLVVDPRVGRGTRGAEPVDGDPGAHLVRGPGVGVGPVVQLLVDPGEQRDGGVGQGVAEGLRLGGLFGAVAGAFVEEPARAREAGALAGRGRGEGVLGGQERVGGPGGADPVVHVDVCG